MSIWRSWWAKRDADTYPIFSKIDLSGVTHPAALQKLKFDSLQWCYGTASELTPYRIGSQLACQSLGGSHPL